MLNILKFFSPTDVPVAVSAANPLPVTMGGAVSVNVQGPTAADAPLTANPVTTGGLAATALPAAVAAADVVNDLKDTFGRSIAISALRGTKRKQTTTITSSTGETTIVTADADEFLDLFGLTIANTSATACNVTIRDATAGAIVFMFAVPAGDTRGFRLDCGSATPQAALNNNWTAQCSASVASIIIAAETVANK